DPEQLNGQRVSASFLPTLGVTAALGRNFTADEDLPNGPPVCIISHELWQTRFGARPDLVGRTITLNGQPWEVVGVMPPRLTPPFVAALVGPLQPTFYTLLGAVGFVLLVACANVASLFLGRLTARRREVAVRQSLGATRASIVRQFLVESLAFSAVAGGAGTLM